MTILVTGGAGFIGSNFILDWLAATDEPVVNIDKLTYAGNLGNLAGLKADPRHIFVHADIADSQRISELLLHHNIRALIHFAAESHVDRSIKGPEEFIKTNVLGTFYLLEAARHYWHDLAEDEKNSFRFIQVSTDEVFGSLSKEQARFTETNPYLPNSPYSASKAGADHLVRAYHHTYGFPVITTNCSNNYGPYQFPEKLIPLCIHKALAGEKIPIYGDGQQIRDWLYVSDHCSALRCVLDKGIPGQMYAVGGWNEQSNLQVVTRICAILDELKPRADSRSYVEQIAFVTDRPGHDQRYAIDASKIERELGWKPAEEFLTGIYKTVSWYLENQNWTQAIISGAYRQVEEYDLA
ncbi:MAG: dTDP-glucose 4,6-dehydratase [Legionella sp.]|jgi:dTDP-glucose 4,6-dehydratase